MILMISELFLDLDNVFVFLLHIYLYRVHRVHGFQAFVVVPFVFLIAEVRGSLSFVMYHVDLPFKPVVWVVSF